MVSQSLEDKLNEFLDQAGRISTIEKEIKIIKENHLTHIESDINSIKKDISEIKSLLKK